MPFPNAALDQPINAEMDHRETGADRPKRYRKRTHMLVLADCGGSNGSRNRAWKFNLQHRPCDPNLVTVVKS